MNEKDLKKQALEELGLYYGIYAASVQDNKDPEDAFRLKVKCPAILGKNGVSEWALPCGVFAGKGYGILALPQKGDNVWLSFLNGDVRQPIWQYGAIAKGEKPEDAKAEAVAIIAPNKTKIVIKENGKVEIKKGAVSLGSALEELFACLKSSQVMTPAGLGAFTPAVVTQLTEIETKIKSILE